MALLTDLTLWKKISLLTTLGLVFGVGVFSSIGMRAVNQSTEAMLQDRLTTASLVADYVDEALGRASLELKNTANLLNESTAGNPGPAIAALNNMYARLSVYAQGIYLLDETGRVIWSYPQTRGDTLNLAQASIREAMETNEVTISGLVSAPATEAPAILLAYPTRVGEQKKGVLVAAIDLNQSSIGGFVQPIRLGRTGYVEIVDRDGVVVARTEPGPRLAPFEQSDHSGRFAALIATGQPTRGVCHTCHEPDQKVSQRDVLAFVPLSRTNWGVVVRQAEEEALAPIRELRQNLFLFGMGLVTIALLFVVITTRDIGSRITALTAAARRIASGDLVTPIATPGKDEVGVLAHSLNEMRVKLNASYGELEEKTKELTSLLSVSEVVTSTFDLSRLLDAVVARAVEIIPGGDAGVLLLEDSAGRELAVRCAAGRDSQFSQRLVPLLNLDLSARPVDHERPENTREKAIATVVSSEVWPEPVRGHIEANIVHHKRYIGSLVILSFSETPLSSHLQLLEAIADYIAIAIERAELSKEAAEARALHEADRLRAQFISSVSHELRTPLTLIKGYSTSLLRENSSWDKGTQREFLQIIDEKTDELRDLIDKLLQSAKLEAGALRLEKEPVLLPRLALKVVEEMAPRTRKHRLTLDFPEFFPVVEADTRCLEQVLRNLVENAIKYSPEGGRVVVEGRVEAARVVLSVKDEGMGIAPEFQPKIFERFYRVETALTRGIHGSGLGLSITKGHIEAHGGEVWLESSPGHGSRFYFSLPLERAGSNAEV